MDDEIDGTPARAGHDGAPVRYAGFWRRSLAALIDSVLIVLVLSPVAWLAFGEAELEVAATPEGLLAAIGALTGRLLFDAVFAAVAVVAFWLGRAATPGKMLVSARIADARTGEKPGTGQCIGRYLGYFVALAPLGLGLLWVAWDPRKQGWHDKLAGTVVIHEAGQRRRGRAEA